ncbi:hypothetical protein MRX96_022329 [Rhipicephalus microplus]
MAQHISDDRANLRKIRPVPRRFPAMQRAAADVRDAALSSYELSQASLSATEDSPSQAAVLLEASQDNHREPEGHTSAMPHTSVTTRTKPLRAKRKQDAADMEFLEKK